MKYIFLSLFVFLNTLAQNQNIKVVFDITSSSPKAHKTAIKHLSLMANAYPDSEFELVMYSGSGKMATYENKEIAEKLSEVVYLDNARVILCEATMNKLGLKRKDLVEGVETVPDGILEIAIKQSKGWSYIKEGLNSSN